MYEFETDKVGNIAENLEKGIRYIGKAMQVAEELCGGGETGYRNGSGYNGGGSGYRIGMRGNYGGRSMGYREDEEEPKYDEYGNPVMGMRRMRDSRGRFM